MKTLADLIQHYGLDLNARGAILDVPTNKFYSGFTMRGSDFLKVPDGFFLKEAWSNGFREVWINQEERAIFTFTEGDLDLTIDATLGDFNRRLDRAAEFYAVYA